MTYLAIGAVTKSIVELLSQKLNKPPLMGASAKLRVTTLPPDDDRIDVSDGVNLFLYRLSESPFASNMDWPGDRSKTGGAKRPPLALTLHYLLTAYAKKSSTTAQDDITAHQILGNAMAILHDYPVLNDIHDSEFDAELDEHFPAELRAAYEKIKITRTPITMEEYSKIWTGLGKAYRLSAAYDVSLVQIAPQVSIAAPSPPIQRTSVKAEPVATPNLVAIEPVAGPAGQTVKLKGSGFTCRGCDTSVAVGDTELSEADLLFRSDRELSIAIPEVLTQGPQVPIRVMLAGQKSAPARYEVRPWIRSLKPLRGITGIPLLVSSTALPAGTVTVEIDGQAVAATLDPERKTVRMIVPASIATNGPKPVVVIVDVGTPQRSNVLFYEVLPVLLTKHVTTATSPESTTITMTGLRLKGKDVQVRYGALLLRKGENTTPTQLTLEVPRALPPDEPVSVIVDGRESNPVPPRLERIEPPRTFVGDTVSLAGKGLSGQNVVITFGTQSLPSGPQVFSSRIVVAVPSGLAPGNAPVKVTVEGNASNVLPFEVIP